MTNLEKWVSLTKKGHSELYLCTKDPINSVKLETSGIVSCFVLPTIVEPLLSGHLLMATPFRWLIIKVPMSAFLLFLLLLKRQPLLSHHYPFPEDGHLIERLDCIYCQLLINWLIPNLAALFDSVYIWVAFSATDSVFHVSTTDAWYKLIPFYMPDYLIVKQKHASEKPRGVS